MSIGLISPIDLIPTKPPRFPQPGRLIVCPFWFNEGIGELSGVKYY